MPIDKFLRFYTTGVNAQGDNEAVAIGGDRKKSDGKPDFRMRRWTPGREPEPTTQLYFCCSTVRTTSARQKAVQRRLVDLVRTFVIVLDDVGTAPHSKVHPDVIKIAPNDRLETSPDNYQYFYKLEHGADPAEAAAVLEALAVAGWTDPGSTDAAHVFRLPGAVNEGRGGFKARLDEAWSRRERTWTLTSFTVELAKHGVVVGSARPIADELPPMAEGDVDPLFDRLQEADDRLVLGAPERGWYPVPCPQTHGKHTTGEEGDGSTGYKPSHGGGVFRCRHGHCKDKVTTADFQEWIWQRDAAGFRASLAAALNNASRNKPEGESVRFVPPPAITVRSDILANYIHVESEDKYWSIMTSALVKYSALDHRLYARMLHAGLLDGETPTGKPTIIQPQVWFKRQVDTRRVGKITHRLGQPLVVDGCLNIAPPVPARIEAMGEPEPWLNLVDFVCGDDDDADQALDWMALVVGAWDEKPGWHLLLKGPHGVGKDLMIAPLVHYLAPKHWYGITVKDIEHGFTPFLARRLIVLDELKMTTRGTISTHDIYNSVKAWTARGTGWVMINEKNMKPYEALDLSCWVLTSNAEVPLPLEEGDRRWDVIETPRLLRPKIYYEKIVKWIDSGGWQVVIAWLQQRWAEMSEARRQAVRGTAPVTKAKRELIINSAEGIEGAVRLAVLGQYGETWPDLMKVDDVLNLLRDSDLLSDQGRRSLTKKRVAMALKAAGAVQLFDGGPVEDSAIRRTMRLWCLRPDKVNEYEQLGKGKALVEEYDRQHGSKSTFSGVKGAHLKVVPSDT